MRAAFHTLGCKVNTYETDAMEQMMRDGGYEIVPFDKGADVYIINTCSVTNMADHKSRQMLRRARKMNPNAVVVAVGCYVQADPKKAVQKQDKRRSSYYNYYTTNKWGNLKNYDLVINSDIGIDVCTNMIVEMYRNAVKRSND